MQPHSLCAIATSYSRPSPCVVTASTSQAGSNWSYSRIGSGHQARPESYARSDAPLPWGARYPDSKLVSGYADVINHFSYPAQRLEPKRSTRKDRTSTSKIQIGVHQNSNPHLSPTQVTRRTCGTPNNSCGTVKSRRPASTKLWGALSRRQAFFPCCFSKPITVHLSPESGALVNFWDAKLFPMSHRVAYGSSPEEMTGRTTSPQISRIFWPKTLSLMVCFKTFTGSKDSIPSTVVDVQSLCSRDGHSQTHLIRSM